MLANLNDWKARLLPAGCGMLLLSLLLILAEMERFQFVPVEGHVFELMMYAFAAGYSLYAGISLPLLRNAWGRLKSSAKDERGLM